MILYEIDENQSIRPANYSLHAGDVEWVQHHASVAQENVLKPGVAGEKYKPVGSVDRALY